MRKTISTSNPIYPLRDHEEHALNLVRAIERKNHEEVECLKRAFCNTLLRDATSKVIPPVSMSFLAEMPSAAVSSSLPELPPLPEGGEPEYMKVFIKIARKLIIEKQMNPEDIIEILCTDKNFVEWLIQKAKEIVNYVVKKVSGGKYSPFEDDVLLGSVDLKSHAEDVLKTAMNDEGEMHDHEAGSSSTAGVRRGDWTKHVTAVAVGGGRGHGLGLDE